MSKKTAGFFVYEVILSVALSILGSGFSTVSHAEETTAERGDPFSIVNAHVQPLGLLFGIWGGDLSFRVAHDVELGLSFEWFEIMSTDQVLTARQVGINATLFPFGRAPNGGYFIRPGFYYIPVTEEDRSGLTGTQTVANFSAGLLVGHEWMWPVGFNISLAAGVVYHRTPSTEAVQLAGTTFHESIVPVSDLEPSLEWSVGWAF